MRLETRIALLLAMALAAFAWPTPRASAQSCTFTMTDINFGAVANAQINATATLSASCTGTRNTTVKICPHFGDGTGYSTSGNPRLLTNGVNTANFQLYSNSGRTTVWGSALWPYSARPPKMTVSLNGSGNGTKNQTVYARYNSGQGSIPAGTYISSFSTFHIAVKYKYDDGANCNSDTGGVTASPQPEFTVRADRTISCSVTANEVNFGSVMSLTSAVNGQGSLGVNCTRNTPYSVSLGNGLYGTAPTNRRMAKGSERITYGLYTDAARVLPWGTGSSEVVTETGTGSAQTLQVYGRVPVQTTPSTGVYTDTVVVTVTY